MRSRTPLWLAVSLKKTHKCRILLPEWLSPQRLQTHLDSERTSAGFSNLPHHYLELAALVLGNEHFANADHIRAIISDLREIRTTKVRAGLHSLDGQYLQVPSTSSRSTTLGSWKSSKSGS